jgi:pyruvate dehydrogenase E1 component
VPLVTALLNESAGPITAVTDFMTAVPDQIARFVPTGRPFHVLGTDGMGRSDTREALRRFFEVDTAHVVLTVLTGLVESGDIEPAVLSDAIQRYGIDPEAADPFII